MVAYATVTKEYSLLSFTSVYFIHRSDSTVDLPVLQARGYVAVPLHLTGWGIRVRPHGWGTQYCTKNLVWRQASGRSPTSHVRTCERIGEGEAPFRSVVATGNKQNKQTNKLHMYMSRHDQYRNVHVYTYVQYFNSMYVYILYYVYGCILPIPDFSFPHSSIPPCSGSV